MTHGLKPKGCNKCSKTLRKGLENMPDKPVNVDFKRRVELFERYYNDPDQYHKIFTELGFSYVVDDCDGYCSDCNHKLTCEV
jgi:hypothetical protein